MKVRFEIDEKGDELNATIRFRKPEGASNPVYEMSCYVDPSEEEKEAGHVSDSSVVVRNVDLFLLLGLVRLAPPQATIGKLHRALVFLEKQGLSSGFTIRAAYSKGLGFYFGYEGDNPSIWIENPIYKRRNVLDDGPIRSLEDLAIRLDEVVEEVKAAKAGAGGVTSGDGTTV